MAKEDFESGSDGQVLKNYLGVTSAGKMALIEGQQLERAELEAFSLFTQNHQFTGEDI